MNNISQSLYIFHNYFICSGFIYVIYFLLYVIHEESFKEHLANLRQNTGLDNISLIILGTCVAFICGCILLPKVILKLLGILSSNNREDK